MAKILPPTGKGARLAAQERTVVPHEKKQPRHIPTAAPSRRVPLPHVLDPKHDTRFQTPNRSIPPPPAPTRRARIQPPTKVVDKNTSRYEPAHHVSSRTSSTPFFPGQKPSGYMRSRTAGRGPRSGKRVPIYTLPHGGPGGDEAAQLSSVQLAQAAQERHAEIGTPGIIFRSAAESLVPKTFVDVGAGRAVHVGQIAKDFANATLNFAPLPGSAAAAAIVGRGGKLARAFTKAAIEGRGVEDAAVEAARVAKGAKLPKLSAQVVKDTRPALKSSVPRRDIHAEIDATLPEADAARTKEALDHAAIDHAQQTLSTRHGPRKERRQAGIHEFYDSLHEQIARSVAGQPRTYIQARVRLDTLNRQIDAFLEKASKTIGHPSGLTDRQLGVEAMNVGKRNAKRLRQEQGVTKSGRRSGASGYKSDYEPSVRAETLAHTERVIDQIIAAHPDIPEFQAYKKLIAQRDELAAAVAQHEEQALGALPGEEPAGVDFGTHPAFEPQPSAEAAPAVPPEDAPPVPPEAPVPPAPTAPEPGGDMLFSLEPSGATALPTGAAETSVMTDPAVDLATHRANQEMQQYQDELRRQLRIEFDDTPDYGGHQPRTLNVNDLTVQIPKPRSTISSTVAEHVVDRASKALDRTVATDIPGLRLLTATERGVKGAGRAQRIENPRRLAAVAQELKVLEKIPEGSAEDQATFWYAQLPEGYRNAEGLARIRDAQAAEQEFIRSGQARAEIDRREQALLIARREAQNGEWRTYQRDLDEIPNLRADLPRRLEDITASIETLNRLIANPPPVNRKALDAMRTLAKERRDIFVAAGRLEPGEADARAGLLSRALGLPSDGTEIYVGHRLPDPESFRGSFMPSGGGTGRVGSPRGIGSRNELVLFRNGRMRASTRVSYEDWQAAQVFDAANKDRDNLWRMGQPFHGHVPKGYVLVNRGGETIPRHWRTDELAQINEDDRDEIRQKAKDIISGFVADDSTDPGAVEEMIRIQRERNQPISDLRLVRKRLLDRYYSQFRSFKGRSMPGVALDTMTDAISTSIIFARVGYIPKNAVQNLVMALPHQGAFFPINAIRTGQVLADPELRALAAGEMAGSSATASIANVGKLKGVTSGLTHFVTNVADEPFRVSAFLHEAAAEGVISKVNPLLSDKDRAALLDLFKNPRNRAKLNDIHQRAVDAMGDFTRLTPDQARTARRMFVIPGWLVAGSRYPFHFAATHPIRSALLAYAALGEPGAPDNLTFNQPIWKYFKGDKYLTGIDTRWGRFRTASLNPISTPWDLAQAIAGSIRGKKSPFDYKTPTAFDEIAPFWKAAINAGQGNGVLRALESLIPDYKFVMGLIDPHASASYPDDATWQGRLKREFGIIPIHISDTTSGTGPLKTPRRGSNPPGLSGGSGGGGGWTPGGSGGGWTP